MATPRAADVLPARLLCTDVADWASEAELARLDALCDLLPDRTVTAEIGRIAGEGARVRITAAYPVDYEPTEADVTRWRAEVREALVTHRRRAAVRTAEAAGVPAAALVDALRVPPWWVGGRGAATTRVSDRPSVRVPKPA